MKRLLMKLRESLPRLILGALLAFGLVACGQKGGLTRPEQSSLTTTFPASATQTTAMTAL